MQRPLAWVQIRPPHLVSQVMQNATDGRMLDVGVVFHLANVLTNHNKTKLVGECIATGRVRKTQDIEGGLREANQNKTKLVGECIATGRVRETPRRLRGD